MLGPHGDRKLLLDTCSMIALRDAVLSDGDSLLKRLAARGCHFALPIAVVREMGVDIWEPIEISTALPFVHGSADNCDFLKSLHEHEQLEIYKTCYCVPEKTSRHSHGLAEHAGEKAVHELGRNLAKQYKHFLAVCDDSAGLDRMIGAFKDGDFGGVPPVNFPVFLIALQKAGVIDASEHKAALDSFDRGHTTYAVQRDYNIEYFLRSAAPRSGFAGRNQHDQKLIHAIERSVGQLLMV
jgi:hypothetical protein